MTIKRTLHLALTATVALLAALPAPAAAQQQDSAAVRALLDQRDREIKDLVGPEGAEYTEAQREQLKDIINGIIDYRSMAAYALQQTWDTLSVEERDEFVEVFSTVVRDQSMNNLDIYRARVEYLAIRVNGDSARVHTTVMQDASRIPVHYDMNYDGEWTVTDIVIDDVSTAESYRSQYQRIISQRGYQVLLEALRKRAGRG
ncbi:MAG: ABC transporter substrate-binding protein [Balneolaceae bacterium]|nr:ABC transporter substrate-binding protein [Balneolaceae bacterium]